METIAEVALYETKIVKPGETCYAQLRMAEPTLLLPGDRFIVRQFSPVVTIGGGVVIENTPPARISNRQAHVDLLQILAESDRGANFSARVATGWLAGFDVA